jgi:hypothetical protein
LKHDVMRGSGVLDNPVADDRIAAPIEACAAAA